MNLDNIKDILHKFYNSLKNDKDYKNLLRDILKYSTLIVVINLLFYISKTNTSFFNSLFIDIECFMIVALCAYWLVVNKLISF